jgi:FKBP-type peptidyl-prolyl cis-trans isomerase SlyD
MNIAKNMVVSLNYSARTPEGQEVDSSEGQGPLVYLHGYEQVLPGLERALEGKTAGDHVAISLAPADAYGEYDDGLDLRVPKDAFPEDAWAQIQPGVRFVAAHPAEPEREVLFHVIELEDDTALITGNHPLAGETLNFEVDVIEVREATLAELAHGHAHGDDAHDHDDEPEA